MDLAIDKNLVDKDEYPQTAEIERRCVTCWPTSGTRPGRRSGLLHDRLERGGDARRAWRRSGGGGPRRAAGKPVDSPNMVCGAVQICWHKFARYWDIEIREVGMRPATCLEPEDVLAQVDENTIFVVPTLGVTYHGLYENVSRSPRPSTTGHAPASTSPSTSMLPAVAFSPPSAIPTSAWDFRLPRVKCINASGHKFGLAPLGVGWVLWRDPADLPDDLIFHVSYLGGDMPTFQINFSRPAGQVIAQYYDFVRLGREGYAAIHDASYEVGRFLAERVPTMGPFELLYATRTRRPASRPSPGGSRRARTPATRCSTSPTDCG